MDTNELSRIWREQSRAYVAGVNDFVTRDIASQGKGGDEPPVDTRASIAAPVLDVVKAANRAAATAGLRDAFPPAFEPFAEEAKNAPQIEPMLLPDGRIVARVGAPYDVNRLGVVVIGDTGYERVPGALAIGRCPRRQFFAVADETGITVTDGWQGAVTSRLAYPRRGAGAGTLPAPPTITALRPFPDGRRVLLVSSEGVWVVTDSDTVPLLPSAAESAEYSAWHEKEYGNAAALDLSMEHGAVSGDGKWIAAGHQDGKHRIFSGDSYELVAQVGPHGEYPHFTLFSAEDRYVALNACHFYSGATVRVAIADLPGMVTDFYEDAPPVRVIDSEARVYAGAARRDEYLLGDAYGYVRGCGIDDGLRWRHFVGGTVSGMDLSADGRRLLVGTYAGILADIELDADTAPDPFVVGYGAAHRETRRYLFWGEPGAMLVW